MPSIGLWPIEVDAWSPAMSACPDVVHYGSPKRNSWCTVDHFVTSCHSACASVSLGACVMASTDYTKCGHYLTKVSNFMGTALSGLASFRVEVRGRCWDDRVWAGV